MNIILALLLYMGYSHQPAFLLKQQKLELDNGTKLLYTSLTPSLIPRNQKVPLVIALHWGWDREKPIPQWFGKDFLTGIVQPAFEGINPIIVAPDCPSDNWYNPVSENAVLAVMNAVMKKYPVDSSRIFITGFSAGGIGTWYISSRHPELFSMAIPMACKPEEEWIREWTDLPVYIIHGTDDELFPFSEVENIATELAGKKTKIKLMKVEHGTHYDTGRFIPPLKYSHIWYSELDKE